MRNRQLTELVRDVPLDVGAGRPRRAAVGPRRGAPAVRRPAVPGAARAAVRDPGDGRAGGRARASRSTRRRCSRPATVRGVAGRARPRRQPGRASPSRGTLGPRAPASVDRARAGRGATGAAALGRPGDARPRTTSAALGRVAGRPGRAQGGARRQGRRCSRCAARGWTLRRRRQRHRAGRLPGAARASAPSTSPTWRCATCTASCAPAARPTSGQLTFDGGEDEADAATPTRRWSRPARSLDLADALDAELAERGGDRAAAPTSSCRWSACSADMERDRHRRRRRRTWPSWRPSSPAQVEAGRAGRLRGRSAGVQPRLAQAAAGGAVRRAGHAQDQADQDRLHHRRRRAAVACTSRPSTRSSTHLLRHRDVDPAARSTVEGLLQVGRRRRPDPHHLQPDRSRPPGGCPRTDPNLQNIPIRTEEGRRIRRGVRRRRRATSR